MFRKTVLVVFISLLLTSCTKPLPEEKLEYAGDWQSKEMRLLILADGTVAYRRLKNGVTTSIDAPLKEFSGNDFIVGVGPITTTFKVGEPPHDTESGWQMVVDGVRLTKVSE